MIGETIGRYRIEGELGHGGMGRVYRARDLRLERAVALKFLPEHLATDPATLARFEREARLASSLNHPNICIVHDIDRHDGHPFIVMELCPGETVKRMIERGPIPLELALQLAIQAARALGAAHRRGIVHRDVKPANLFVSPGGQLKVLDFGLAKPGEPQLAAADSLPAAPELELTRPGTALGTVAYMSPEQALGQAVDARSDLFSLGAVLYEMVTGTRAFAGPTPGAVFDRILNREPRRASRVATGVPEELDAVLERLLAKQPDGRYPGASELASDLEQVASRLLAGEAASGAQAPPHRRFSAPWSAWHKAALAAVVVLGLAGAVRWALRPAPPLTQRDPVLLAGFDNHTGEAVFDATLAQALAVQLGQSPFLNIVADDRVRETLTLMGREPSAPLDSELAREVCHRLGTRAMVRGSIARLGELYLLLLEASECASGAALAREQGQARSAEQVLDTLGRVSSRLRERVGESLGSVRAFDVPVARATTPSLEALRAYTLGVEQRRRGAEVEAIPFFVRALELDPGFAAAATTLSTVYGNLGEDSKSVEYARMAYGLREKVSQRERLFIGYQYHDRATGDLEQAADTLQVWKRTFPNDFQPANALAIIHGRLGRYEQGALEAKEALARTPGHPFAVSNLAHAYRALGRYAEARELALEVVARGVATVPTRRLLYQLDVLRGEPAAAEQQLEWAKGTPREFDLIAASAQLSAYEGRLARAAEGYRESVALAQARSLPETGRALTAHAALAHALYGRRGEALALSRQALAPRPDGSAMTVLPRVRLLAVLGLLGAPEAARLAEALARTLPSSTLVKAVVLPTTRAAMALQQGRHAEAVEALRPAAVYEAGNVAVLIPAYLRGCAYLGSGQAALALEEFRKILARRGVDPFSPVMALAPLGEARALAMLGEREPAARAYQEFFAAWQAADPELPVLRAARAEHARLGVR